MMVLTKECLKNREKELNSGKIPFRIGDKVIPVIPISKVKEAIEKICDVHPCDHSHKCYVHEEIKKLLLKELKLK